MLSADKDQARSLKIVGRSFDRARSKVGLLVGTYRDQFCTKGTLQGAPSRTLKAVAGAGHTALWKATHQAMPAN